MQRTCVPLLLPGSDITAEEGVDAAFAFVEARPESGAFVFAAWQSMER